MVSHIRSLSLSSSCVYTSKSVPRRARNYYLHDVCAVGLMHESPPLLVQLVRTLQCLYNSVQQCTPVCCFCFASLDHITTGHERSISSLLTDPSTTKHGLLNCCRHHALQSCVRQVNVICLHLSDNKMATALPGDTHKKTRQSE